MNLGLEHGVIASCGTVKGYAQGCRCELCMREGLWWQAAWRKGEAIDKQAIKDARKAHPSSCDCEECIAKRAKKKRGQQARRNKNFEKMMRGEIAPEHGKPSTYSNYLCRCRPCTDATTAYKRKYQKVRDDG